jgi:DNA-binding IclR family transcriptional regulator
MADYSAQEKAAVVVWLLGNDGAEMTTNEIAARVGTSWGGAYRMMQRLSHVTPVVRDGSVWRMVREDDGDAR